MCIITLSLKKKLIIIKFIKQVFNLIILAFLSFLIEENLKLMNACTFICEYIDVNDAHIKSIFFTHNFVIQLIIYSKTNP